MGRCLGGCESGGRGPQQRTPIPSLALLASQPFLSLSPSPQSTLSAGPAATAVLTLPPTFVSPTATTSIPASSPYPPPPFDAAAALARLGTARLGHVLLAAPVLPSTQTLLQGAGGALPDGTVAVADVQMSGRGRAGNAWASPPGCLMASAFTAAAPIPGARLPFVQYAVALAVVRGVKALVEGACLAAGWGPDDAARWAAGADVRIKWPNDVYAGPAAVPPSASPPPPSAAAAGPAVSRKKLAGVLCHSTYVSGPGGAGPGAGGAFRVVAGFGVNVTNEPATSAPAPADAPVAPPMLEWARVADLVPLPAGVGGGDPGAARAAAVEAAGGRPALLAAILGEVEAGLARLAASGASWAPGGADAAAYLATWLHTGQVVTVVDPPEAPGGGSDRRGKPPPSPPPDHPPRPPAGAAVTITGLAPSGYLLAVDGVTGTAYELHPDGNSLDFFQGLVRRKVVK